MSSRTKSKGKKKGKPATGKKTSKQTVTPVEADVLPPADVTEVQVQDAEKPTEAEASRADTKPRKRRRGAPAATAEASQATPAAKPLSCLDAAAAVLQAKGQPMRCKEMIAAMAEQGLWSSAAATPAATLYSAILREIDAKGDKARFKKTDRGHFALNT